jgi:TolB-like protein/DNA-binding winged helix-turn-helix (wHTH) protein
MAHDRGASGRTDAHLRTEKEAVLSTIDLARTRDFAMGPLNIRPSLRQVEYHGESHTLEPRVMQVLIAFAQRAGAVVSRDDLVVRCWDGRAASDDAINRCLTPIRRLGQTTGAFTLETITRVGYRLIPAPETHAPAARTAHNASSSHADSLAPWNGGSRLLAGIAVLLLALAAVLSGLAPRAPAVDPSIAVLPFESDGTDPQRAYLGRAIAGEIVELLAQLDGVHVIARNSSFAFPAEADIREVGRQLDVAHVLTGKVSEEHGMIRVSTTLSDTATRRVTWSRSETLGYTPENVSGIQKLIARQVAGAMSIAFKARASSGLAGGSTKNLEAYDSYLRGVDYWWRGGTGTQLQDAFRRAIELDPDYAEAWAGLAIAYGYQSLTQLTPERAQVRQAEGYGMAQRAVKLAPDLSMTQATFGALSTTQRKWREAEEATRRALSISRDEFPLMHRTMMLARVGRSAEAYAMLQESLAADPLRDGPGFLDLLGTLPAAGKSAEMLKLAAHRGWFTSDDFWSLVDGLEARIAAGEPAPAIRQSLERLSRASDLAIAALARDLVVAFDDHARARAILRTAYDDTSFRHAAKWQLVTFLAAWFGDIDLVLRAWRDELPVNTAQTIFIWGPAFSKVRSLPAFKDLARDIGYVDYWRHYRWADKCRPLTEDDFECV